MGSRRQVMIRRHEPGTAGHHTVAIVIGVAGEGDVEAVLQTDQALHRIG